MQSSDLFEISVVILALNEEKNIAGVLGQVSHELLRQNSNFEVIVVDGGSGDQTATVARQYGAKVFLQSTPGYAAALKEGLSAARGTYIVTLDADGSHNSSLIPSLLEARTVADIIIGSRWISGGAHHGSITRALLSKVLNRIFKRILSLPINDLSSGYRLYKRSAIVDKDYKAQDFSILQEIIIRALGDGYIIKEIPLTFQERQSGSSNVRMFFFAWSYLKTLWTMWRMRNNSEGH